MKNLQIVLAIIGLVLLFTFTRSFNVLSVKNSDIKTQWERLEGPLERRNDLIRDLVNDVRGPVAAEEKTLDELSALRLQWVSVKAIKEKLEVVGAMDTALSRLLKVTDNLPGLKNREAFIRIMDELLIVENRIKIEKMQYNEAARNYNIKVRNFPSNIIANLLGYKLAAEYPDVQ